MIDMQDAYKIGRADFLDGIDKDACPYLKSTMLSIFWLSGWMDECDDVQAEVAAEICEIADILLDTPDGRV